MTGVDTEAFELEWADGGASASVLERIRIDSAAELNENLDRLQAQAVSNGPFIAELIAPGGASLGIGLGLETTVLAFKTGPTSPPYYVSHAAERSHDRDEAIEVGYMYQGHWTEFSADSLVSMELGRQAMRDFLATGDLPSSVPWNEV